MTTAVTITVSNKTTLFDPREDSDSFYLASESIATTRAWARRLHGTQTEKNGKPYLTHLDAVARNVMTFYPDAEPDTLESLMRIAYLHDTVEDTIITDDDLSLEGYTEDVIRAVLAMTKKPNEPNPEYMTRVLANPWAALVKLADLTHNTEPTRLAVLTKQVQERLKKKYYPAIWRIETEYADLLSKLGYGGPTMTFGRVLDALDYNKLNTGRVWRETALRYIQSNDIVRFPGSDEEFVVKSKHSHTKDKYSSVPFHITLTFEGGETLSGMSNIKVEYVSNNQTFIKSSLAKYLGVASWSDVQSLIASQADTDSVGNVSTSEGS